MRKTFLFSVLLFAIAGMFTAAVSVKRFKNKTHHSKVASEYNIALPCDIVTKERPFTIVIPSYNNEKYCEKNIRSALDQEYSNFQIFFIDDASTDRTFSIVKEVMEHHPNREKVKLVSNSQNQGALANFYNAIHSLENHEIVVVLDGDDQLAHNKVLQTLNTYYENPAVWLTYGSYLEYPSYKQGVFSQPIDKEILREGSIKRKAWMTSHLRTFYAGLFKRISLKDLIYKGRFLPSSADVAMMLPMIEMARDHTYFIPEVLYIYNTENPINDSLKNRKKQEFFDEYVRKKPVYTSLVESPTEPFLLKAKDKADVVIFSYNRPLQLYSCLESLEKNLINQDHIFVLYRASEEKYEKAYDELKNKFPAIEFFQQPNINAQDAFKPMVIDLAFNQKRSNARYIAFCTDDIVVKEEIDFFDGILALKKTGAYGFFYRLGKHVTYCYMCTQNNAMPHFIPLGDHLFAWQFSDSSGDFDYPNTVDFTLYEKARIEPLLRDLDYKMPNKMEEFWAAKADHSEIGLCYTTSKIVNIPLNIVSEYEYQNKHLHSYTAEELQKKFDEGLKIDIAPLQGVKNISAHMEYEPTFVMR